MIEIISAERCTGCNICVHVCPTNVFDLVPGQPPAVARQGDCQTCFMCEVYCSEDALYVAPTADHAQSLAEHDPGVQALLGSYRSSLGWGPGRASSARTDNSFELLQRAH